MSYYKIFPLLLSICLFGACVKDEIPETHATPDPIIPAGMHAKINGVPWTASSVSHFSLLGGMHYIEVSGYDSTGKSLKLVINNFKSKTTYNVPTARDSAFYALDYNVFASPQPARNGKITIQAINDSMVGGSFNFNTDSTNITEGTFYVNYN